MSSNMDGISQLPEPILEHILSSLPLKEAARMSGLSTTWKIAYNSISSLNFGSYFFYEPLEKLVNVVHPMLAYRQKHKISIEKFSLRLPCTKWTCQLYNWIDTLVECNIKELNVRVTTKTMPTGYHKLPESIFNAKALKVLRLSGFHIQLTSSGTIEFSSSLREFHVDHVLLDEEFMQAICTRCCNLEVLIVESVDGLASFQTCLPKLKKIELMGSCISKLQLVDIRAPILEDLQIYIFRDYTLKEDLKVVRINGCCKALKSLYLDNVPMTQKWFDEIFSCLENLEKFELYHCDMLKTIKISSFLLKQLRVHCCYNVIDVELDTPNLIRLSYDCTALPTLKLKASTSLEANITFASGAGEIPDHDWYSKLMKFLDNFNHSMAIELTCKNDKTLVIPKDVRERLLPPLYGTNCVKVNILSRLLNYSVVDVLDNMFWLSPRLDTLSYCEPDIKTLQFLYGDSLGEDEKLCCTSQRWKCWRHKLKQVKMHNFRCMEKKQELRNYFVTNAGISEIIEVPTERFDPEWR